MAALPSTPPLAHVSPRLKFGRSALPNFKRIPQPLLHPRLRRNEFGEVLLPIGREETVAFEITVDARDEQAFAERQAFGVDALATSNPRRAGPLVHALGDDDGLRQRSRPLGAREGFGGISRDDHRPTPRQRLAQLGITGRTFDHHPTLGLVHEPGQVLRNVPRKPAARADDPVTGHGDDALEGFGHGPKGC